MTETFSVIDGADRELLQEKQMPEWLDPMLATLHKESFDHPQWIFERKFDGERVLLFKKQTSIHLLSRNRQDLSSTYPELVDALRKQAVDKCILDGEVVAFKGNTTSFSRLQKRMQVKDPEKARKSRVEVFLYLFDILYLESCITTSLPLRTRKKVLKRTLVYNDPLRYTIHRNEQGKEFYRQACEKGWEGVIAKDSSVSYRHSRSRKWLKFKCIHQQELVICGWTAPQGERRKFGALLVGYYDEGKLLYAGKVGTGFDQDTLDFLYQQMNPLQRRTSPFAGYENESEDIHYITPKLVAEIGFTEWTDDGRLRHPRFLGLRRDKSADEVVRESK